MRPYVIDESFIKPVTRDFYRRALVTMHKSKIPFLIGGAYAFGYYTGIKRDTKDLDVFVHPEDANDTLRVLAEAGYMTELTDEIWLGKTYLADNMVDVIFGSANGIAMVDDEWFDRAREGTFLDFSIKLVPPEEMIWSKSFVMTRDRYDGSDIAHILRICANDMDWQRMLRRFGPYWRILYVHLIAFGFIYPTERKNIPQWIMEELAGRLANEVSSPAEEVRMCRGTLLSMVDFDTDINEWGYCDPRPARRNTCDEIEQ